MIRKICRTQFFIILLSVTCSVAQTTVMTFQAKNVKGSSPQIDVRDLTIPEGQQIKVTTLAGAPVTMKALLGDFASGSFAAINSLSKVTEYSNTGATLGYFVSQAKGPCKVRIAPSIGTTTTWVYNQGNVVDGWFQQEAICEYQITPTDTSAGTGQTIPVAAVVVPANATGDVDVLLEQSTDMITWTQCLPGTYNASTQKRFFRVRAVEK